MKLHSNLEHLNFPRFTFDRDTCDFYLFKKLKSLEIMEVCCFGSDLILRHRNLEKLSIKSENRKCDVANVENFRRSIELRNLKSLKVRGSLFLLLAIYDVVEADYKNLSDITFETFYPTKSITIEFPNDQKYFNSDIGDAFFQTIKY